ncbi:ABC transporter permease subunit [bacterium]|nr:ABC transporter permease subunit [bacterium]
MTRTEQSNKTFTGNRRERKPRRSVRVIDRLARAVITVGGVGSILAVSLVGVFLVVVAAPLFRAPDSGDSAELPGLAAETAATLHPDEHRTLAWTWTAAGGFAVRSLLDGSVRDRTDGGVPANAVAAAFAPEGEAVFATREGTVVLGRATLSSTYLSAADAPDSLATLDVGRAAPLGRGTVRRTPEGQFLLRELEIELDAPVALADAPLRLIDMSVRPAGPVIAALDSTGTVHLRSVTRRRNLLTGQTTVKLRGGSFRLDAYDGAAPRWLLLNGRGDDLFVVWENGRLLRYDASRIETPRLVETVDLVADPGATLTALAFLVGKTSLVAGDSRGVVSVWFSVIDASPASGGGRVWTLAHVLDDGETPGAVTALAPSARSRMLAVGHADGTVRLWHVTNERLLITDEGPGGPVAALALAPRDDALLVSTADALGLTPLDVPHPETSAAALAGAVWYEGYAGPAHVWQSTGGTDDFESKYGLMPLIVGTLKATFYSMLFGLPLALMAALTTSEFLKPAAKLRVKPAIEMMASLPSVVLGFLAALVFAPFLEDRVPQALSTIFTVPFCLLLGAQLWQLLPNDTAIRHAHWKHPAMGLMMAGGVWLAWPAGRLVERLAFAGDIMAWLDGQVGSGLGGWAFLMLPLGGLIAGVVLVRHVDPLLRRASRSWTRGRFVVVDLLKFLGATASILLVTVALAAVLDALGLDPRGGLVGTYVQRNALVVGFVMGFAVIPIIYTIAEDALSAVPDHLRAASLGAGASPWQTAVRVVVPPAMSGLFSATMVGLGRAVGETMIVLMAAGNTPIMDMNVFNGFRTLSANIAVELPEAVQHSTHFRTLFLAALTLFAMTFVVNTLAEIVRMRFRKKAYQL